MCDHNDVTQLEKNMIQTSDGYNRYKCKNCNEMVKKNVWEDKEFNQLYLRHHNLCKKHNFKENKCNWCGVECK